jgi:hypothetical protein
MPFDIVAHIKALDFPIDVRVGADAYASNATTSPAHVSGVTVVTENPENTEGLEAGDPQFVSEGETLGLQTVLYDGNMNFDSSQRCVVVFVAADSSATSAKTISFTGDTMGSLTIFGSPAGYSIGTTGSGVSISSTGAWGNVPVLTATAASATITGVSAGPFTGDNTAFGIQAVAASTALPAPPNCLKGDTPVLVGRSPPLYRPMSSLCSGDTVVAYKPTGESLTTEVRVYAAPGSRGESGYLVAPNTVASSHHIFLKACGHESVCRRCTKPLIEDMPHSCSLSRKLAVEGHATLLASDLGSEVVCDEASNPWYHLVLPDFSWCFQVGNGLLSEGLRHKVGTCPKDWMWTEVDANDLPQK